MHFSPPKFTMEMHTGLNRLPIRPKVKATFLVRPTVPSLASKLFSIYQESPYFYSEGFPSFSPSPLENAPKGENGALVQGVSRTNLDAIYTTLLDLYS